MAPPYEAISVTDLRLALLCHQLCHIAWLLWQPQHDVKKGRGGLKKVLVPGTLLVLNKTDLINIWRILHMQVICIKLWIYDKSNHIWLRIVFNKQSKCCKMLLTAPWLTPLVCANKNLHTDCLCFFSPSVHVASKNKNARYWTINNWQGCCRIRKTSDFYKVKGSCKHPVGGYFFYCLPCEKRC